MRRSRSLGSSFSQPLRKTCGVATIVVVPCDAASRHRATASFQSSGPSSTPGRQWKCRSIKSGSGSSSARASGQPRARRSSSLLLPVATRTLIVLVAVTPAITVRLLPEIVDQNAQDSDVRANETTSGADDALPRRLTSVDAKHHAVGQRTQDEGIGDRHDRGNVQDNEVERHTDRFEKGAHRLGCEQDRRIGSRRPAGNDEDSWQVGLGHRRSRIDAVGQDGDEARAIRDSQDFMEVRTMKVSVDQERLSCQADPGRSRD